MKTCRRGHPDEPGSRTVDGKCKACSRMHYLANRERILERQKQRRRDDPDHVHAIWKASREKHAEARRIAARRWEQANREKTLATGERWRKRNMAKVAEKQRLRRLGRKDGEAAAWVGILLEDPCSYCGEPTSTIDHIVPMAAEGDNRWENYTAACRSCNASKRHTSLLLFLHRRPLAA